MHEKPFWNGQLRLGDYYARWFGSVGNAASHRHFAAQAVFGTEPLTVVGADGMHLTGHCLLIEPDTAHRLFPAPAAELWFLEPTAAFGPPVELNNRLLDSDPIHVANGRPPSFWKDWLPPNARPPLDPRIARAAASINQLISLGSVRLADAALESGLSLGRFRHLFTAEIGMPFQRYVLWRRMIIAFDALGDRCSVTEAAHMAGFSDSPHFCRTIRSMFGIRATDLFIEP